MLRSDPPGGLRDLVLWSSSGWRLHAWSNLVHTVRTGETGMQAEFGKGLYEYLEEHPADAEVFNGVMTRSTRQIAGALALSGDRAHLALAARLLGQSDTIRRGTGGPMPAGERYDVASGELVSDGTEAYRDRDFTSYTAAVAGAAAGSTRRS